MTRTIDEISRELAEAAAVEGKSVHVFLSPLTSDSSGDGSGLAVAVLASAMAGLAQAPRFDGALSLDHVCKCHHTEYQDEVTEDSPVA